MYCAQSLLDHRRSARKDVLKGGPEARSTIFAYGQTGSGKTHTMLGANGGGGGGGGGGERGIYALALAELFHGLPRSGSSGVSGVTVSFFELCESRVAPSCERVEKF